MYDLSKNKKNTFFHLKIIILQPLKSLHIALACFYNVAHFFVAGALQDSLPCPRKRGLSEGLTKAKNRIQDRPLYKLNVKKAARGFIPEEEYRRKCTKQNPLQIC